MQGDEGLGRLFTIPIDEVMVRSPLHEIPEGFQTVGYLTEDPTVLRGVYDDGADRPAWGGRTIHALQERRDITCTFTLDPAPSRAEWDARAAVWSTLFGVRPPTPAPLTVREAAVDVWDALRAFMGLLFATLAAGCARVGDVVADVLFDAYDGALARLAVLQAWRFRRQLVGPLVRLWSPEMVWVATVRRPVRESWRAWARRQAQLPRAVWRG
ncbi:hypothetical protein SEA_MARSHAWN_85 [Mycobacterium phage Marshawn]|uniref:Uncharacterized protein n=1 Tax=Mycobacterium phage Marshawn TaxID=2652423 RepID=A0A5P8D869_9CAUD|nr:hypothetical protein I5H02_gp14 [Mycobacterium phage Marshawn]QFP94871.1 hypothetical protein SEA_MARSHAWN_85 [Mycobacterium phage Marshawn]